MKSFEIYGDKREEDEMNKKLKKGSSDYVMFMICRIS